jgi:hypothetical protein
MGWIAGLLLVPAAALAAPEPKSIDVGKLPKEIRTLHTCAPAGSKVEWSQERYAKSVLFFVSCPAKVRGGFQLQAIYVARDARATGAKRLSFEVRGADGAPGTLDVLPSAIPARETFLKEGDPPHKVQVRNETAWVTGAWRPEERTDVCVVVGQWRVQGDKAELWLWEEAKECPRDATPKYERKVDKKPPELVSP